MLSENQNINLNLQCMKYKKTRMIFHYNKGPITFGTLVALIKISDKNVWWLSLVMSESGLPICNLKVRYQYCFLSGPITFGTLVPVMELYDKNASLTGLVMSESGLPICELKVRYYCFLSDRNCFLSYRNSRTKVKEILGQECSNPFFAWS